VSSSGLRPGRNIAFCNLWRTGFEREEERTTDVKQKEGAEKDDKMVVTLEA
jgi:hypothetical protein